MTMGKDADIQLWDRHTDIPIPINILVTDIVTDIITGTDVHPLLNPDLKTLSITIVSMKNIKTDMKDLLLLLPTTVDHITPFLLLPMMDHILFPRWNHNNPLLLLLPMMHHFILLLPKRNYIIFLLLLPAMMIDIILLVVPIMDHTVLPLLMDHITPTLLPIIDHTGLLPLFTDDIATILLPTVGDIMLLLQDTLLISIITITDITATRQGYLESTFHPK